MSAYQATKGVQERKRRPFALPNMAFCSVKDGHQRCVLRHFSGHTNTP